MKNKEQKKNENRTIHYIKDISLSGVSAIFYLPKLQFIMRPNDNTAIYGVDWFLLHTRTFRLLYGERDRIDAGK